MKNSMTFLFFAWCTIISIELQGHSHFGDRYEFGRFYAERQKKLDLQEALDTDEQFREWCALCCGCLAKRYDEQDDKMNDGE